MNEQLRVPRVRIVVLNYNGKGYTYACLDHLAALEWPKEKLDVVVIDNASTDGSCEYILKNYSWVRLIQNATNTGFPANNLGLIDTDNFDYVAMVNNDAFVSPGWLTPLVATLEHDKKLGAVCSKMLFAPKFVSLQITSPTFSPGPMDPRKLGVRVSGIRLAEKNIWDKTQSGDGVYGLENGDGGTFRWTSDESFFHIPLDYIDYGNERDQNVFKRELFPSTLKIRLCAEKNTTVHVISGQDEVVCEVTTSPDWFEVPLGQDTYDLINNVGSVVFEDGSGADRGYLQIDTGQFNEPVETFAFCGGSVLFRSTYLDDVGLLDESFFLYYEDTDLSWRGQAKGWRYQYVPESQIRHVHSATTVEGSDLFHYYVERNRLLMITKNAPIRFVIHAVFAFLRATASYFRRDVLGPLLKRKRPNTVVVRRRMNSFFGYIKLLPNIFLKRYKISRTRIVSSNELLKKMTPR